jgi:hypothetical protein
LAANTDKTQAPAIPFERRVRKEVTMSTSAISPLSLLESTLAGTDSTSNATQTAVNTATEAGSSLAGASATASAAPDALTQDIVQLLKALVSGNVSAAKNDLAKFKADLSAQSTANALSALGTDATSLLKDLGAGNTSAVKTDVAKIQLDLQNQQAGAGTSSPSNATALNPLDALAGKITDSLASGSTSTALQDLAAYLVQNGQGSGTLLNTTA